MYMYIYIYKKLYSYDVIVDYELLKEKWESFC